MSVQSNPYAPPTAHVEDPVGEGGASEAIRREHIKQEASIRSVGILYYFSAVMLALGAVALLADRDAGDALADGMGGVLSAVLAGMAVLMFVVGRGVRALRPWARVAAIVLGFIGLLQIPLGTLIHGYVLYLMFSAKGRRIFAADYPAIVAATPQVKYRTSILVWILLGLVLTGILAAIIIPLLSG